MLWDEAEATIRTHIEEAWAAGAYASTTLVFENELVPDEQAYVLVDIEGAYADKSIYGQAGARFSIEGGIVFFHAFIPSGGGKAQALALCVAMTAILELQVFAGAIYLEGANPPTPTEAQDTLVPSPQPGGQFYRCSGSVPFAVIGTR